MKKSTIVVIFIFTDGKKILVEKRQLKKFKSEQYLIPGGVLKDKEDLEQALKRESMEELGVKVLSFTLLPHKEKILGVNGQLLIPFLVNTWEGNLPKSILDKGTPLSWLKIEDVLKTSFKPTKKVIEALKAYLIKQNDTY